MLNGMEYIYVALAALAAGAINALAGGGERQLPERAPDGQQLPARGRLARRIVAQLHHAPGRRRPDDDGRRAHAEPPTPASASQPRSATTCSSIAGSSRRL